MPSVVQSTFVKDFHSSVYLFAYPKLRKKGTKKYIIMLILMNGNSSKDQRYKNQWRTLFFNVDECLFCSQHLARRTT